jgi:3-dehydroquinate synthase
MYPVLIEPLIFESLPELIKKYNLPERIFILLDKKVGSLHSSRIKKVLHRIPGKKCYLTAHSSESLKSFLSIQKVYKKLTEENFGRDTLMIAIGGGTIGDAAGFVASTYMRGIHLVHVPTTILSAVDSSIGGKTAINFNGLKNNIGTFYQPSLVIVDQYFFNSLPKKELVSGLGEIIKYSYLTYNKFFSELLSNLDLYFRKKQDFINQILFECIKIKSSVVSQDEKEEKGIRKILNFGHTFAHAFESASDYNFSHGKAVIAGIVSALLLSFKKKLLDKKQFENMISLPLKLKSEIHLNNFEEKELLDFMKQDKKNMDGKIRFVLIKNFRELLVDVRADEKEIIAVLNKTKKLLV